MRRREVWEPWRPEPGQRVRVRLSGECRREWGEINPAGHAVEQDGALGTVREQCPLPGCDLHPSDHPYAVQFDRPIFYLRNGFPFRSAGSHFAAIELEPVSSEDGRELWPVMACAGN